MDFLGGSRQPTCKDPRKASCRHCRCDADVQISVLTMERFHQRTVLHLMYSVKTLASCTGEALYSGGCIGVSKPEKINLEVARVVWMRVM